ncbi:MULTISPECIES: NAD(P)/FAD-dependent oxidoreductase [Alcaligenaceae]|uniref:NAD/FAD-binding protein n=1 Tax=Neopusillimonas maritima TaxID=2026239 RepID=A0ABX9MW06_9BURK|nr:MULTISPECIES: FAD-dependent oxidoreductase [Alcaligenaceae]QIM47786.1 FAD-dependent oxidoreductase [Pusillimonas sp. DMV24BSW_D]RII83098.1 NAD/FAD-binding protein [Neopusillimonas maritima]
MKKVAVVGSGISGLSAAWYLGRQSYPVAVTLFEAEDYCGGHTHTVDVTLPNSRGEWVTHGVDTGFLVFNERTYPGLIELFNTLNVQTAPSDMSFSVQVPAQSLEWCGSNLNTVFAQRKNLLRPQFWSMLSDLVRFNRQATTLARSGTEAQLQEPLGAFLETNGYGDSFRDWYLLPMISSIWSCPADQMMAFPVATLIRFCHNHGLLQLVNRPQWHTVRGGARHYVEKMTAEIPDLRLRTPVISVRRHGQNTGVSVTTRFGTEYFDDIVMACHSDQALKLLALDAHPQEIEMLSAIQYQPNHAVLHTDISVLPARETAWAAWNYEHGVRGDDAMPGVCLHYLLNRLQPLPFDVPVVETLNPLREPDPGKVLARFDYSHPVFDLAARRAQGQLPDLQGRNHTWYCGAWTGYGFHEDGYQSGLRVANQLVECWQQSPVRPSSALAA